MLFSSTLFLFLFLPLVLLGYYALGRRARNTLLLIFSLVFYAWGEAWLVGLMLASIVANYAFGRWVEREQAAGGGRVAVTAAVVFNLGLLLVFKYADWLWQSLGTLISGHSVEPFGALFVTSDWGRSVLLTPTQHLRLPLGISFFTFQAMSYVIDVFRRDVGAQRSLTNFGLYISLFPQLIAGPIVRYRDVAEQIVRRSETVAKFASGVRRFAVGLGKKVLIANTVGAVAAQIFSTPHEQVTLSVAWLGVFAYTLQIYFDFSGYSDMAIGLGRMFGFEFVENFNYPYISRSLTEFWRRWHISLSTWFRDYLYIPMGGGRVGRARVYFNLVVVFALCGLWHGASLNYLLFGCFHGAVLVLERAWLAARLARWPIVLRHVYLMFVVALGWVFFRCEDTAVMAAWFAAMFGFAKGVPELAYPALYLDNARLLALAAGVIGSLPWVPFALSRLSHAWHERPAKWALALNALALAGVLILCALELSASTFNPFIYFRF
ncbi:MAG: MBOAT family O-acyltransferase [Planctomycetota bacterium]